MSGTLLAIDPGGKHCGMALFDRTDAGEWLCVRAWEETPEDCCDSIVEWVADGVSTVVVEEFRLYPWKAAEQSYKTFPEVEVIGVIRWLIRVLREEGKQVEMVEQQASIKEPTAKILRAKKIRSEAKASRAGGHAKDAEVHGWFRILRNEE